MFANKYARHIAGFVPFRLTRHLVPYPLSVDFKIGEVYTFYFTYVVITYYQGQLRFVAVIFYIVEIYIFYYSSWRGAILLIPCDTNVKQFALTEIFDTNVVESYVPDYIVVARHNGEYPLVINLAFLHVKHVYIAIHNVLDCIGRRFHTEFLGASVESDHKGMGHIRP